jgi:protein-disulfide reductase (glutathione)
MKFFIDVMRVLLVAVLAAVVAGSGSDRGFNANIAWSNRLVDSLARATSEGRPAMVLIHKTWCGACKRLKSVFEHPEIETLAREFVMVNLEDDEEPGATGLLFVLSVCSSLT